MIWLHYTDERELGRALLSIARRCEATTGRLCFLGAEPACGMAQGAVRALVPGVPPALTFRHVERLARAASWRATFEIVRPALFQALAEERPVALWIEAPVPREAAPLGPALDAFTRSVEASPAAATLICACRLADLPAEARASLLEVCESVIGAKALLPDCPCWVLPCAKASAGLAPPARSPASPTGPSATFLHAEKLTGLAQLAAGVAHELGNPLSIISSSLQYLHQRLAAANDSASDFTMTALENVERMHRLLRKMLDSAAVHKPEFEQADLKEIISEVLRFTAPVCEQRGIVVEVSFDPLLPRVWVEPSGVKQIVLNLVKNALDATARGGDRLRVLTRSAESGRAAIVEFANNGPPIPRDVLPQLFRPFHTTKDGGTGLGLYVSRQIAKDHGGDLEAENLPQGGVRFLLTLPIDRRGDEDDDSRPDR